MIRCSSEPKKFTYKFSDDFNKNFVLMKKLISERTINLKDPLINEIIMFNLIKCTWSISLNSQKIHWNQFKCLPNVELIFAWGKGDVKKVESLLENSVSFDCGVTNKWLFYLVLTDVISQIEIH